MLRYRGSERVARPLVTRSHVWDSNAVIMQISPDTHASTTSIALAGTRPLADYIRMAQTMMQAFDKVGLSTCYTLAVFDGYQGQVEGTFHTGTAA